MARQRPAIRAFPRYLYRGRFVGSDGSPEDRQRLCYETKNLKHGGNGGQKSEEGSEEFRVSLAYLISIAVCRQCRTRDTTPEVLRSSLRFLSSVPSVFQVLVLVLFRRHQRPGFLQLRTVRLGALAVLDQLRIIARSLLLLLRLLGGLGRAVKSVVAVGVGVLRSRRGPSRWWPVHVEAPSLSAGGRRLLSTGVVPWHSGRYPPRSARHNNSGSPLQCLSWKYAPACPRWRAPVRRRRSACRR